METVLLSTHNIYFWLRKQKIIFSYTHLSRGLSSNQYSHFPHSGPWLRVRTRKIISYFSSKTYVVGTQKNRLKTYAKNYGLENIYAENFCLSKPMLIVFILLFTEELEKAMRQEFNVAEEKEVRLWNRYMTNMYEQLNKKENTLQDAGLYSGQIVVLEQKNEDGTWPRQTLVSKPYVFDLTIYA